MISSATGGEGPVGGQAIRNERNLLQSSALYIAEERLGRSMKLQQQQQKEASYETFSQDFFKFEYH